MHIKSVKRIQTRNKPIGQRPTELHLVGIVEDGNCGLEVNGVQHRSAAATADSTDRTRPRQPSPLAQRPSATVLPLATEQKVTNTRRSQESPAKRTENSLPALQNQTSETCRLFHCPCLLAFSLAVGARRSTDALVTDAVSPSVSGSREPPEFLMNSVYRRFATMRTCRSLHAV